MTLHLEERQMLDRKYSAPPFCKLDETQMQLVCDQLIMKIFVITGWKIPENDLFQDELAKQLALKFSESYSTCNPVEVEYAFRTYGTTVKDYGKNFNLSLVDEVMIPYMNARHEVSLIEEQLKKPKMLTEKKEITQEEKLADIAEWEAKADIRLEYIPPYIFDRFREFGKISVTDEQINYYKAKARDHIKTELYQQWQDNIGRKMIGADLTYKKFMIMYSEKKWSAEYLSHFRNLAKKMIVFEYLTDLKK